MHQLLQRYLSDNSPRWASRTSQTVRHCHAHWHSVHGNQIPTPDLIEAFRSNQLAAGKSPTTIEKTIYRMVEVARHGGHDVQIGRRLRQPRPIPKPPTTRWIGAMYDHVHVTRWPRRLPQSRRNDWWRAWLVLACWTGFRLLDMESIRWADVQQDRIQVLARKTRRRGIAVEIPMNAWLERHLAMIRWISAESLFVWRGRRQLRRELARICNAANVRYSSPQQLRQYAITQWSTANATAGEIVHGRRLGVLDHYIEPFRHLTTVAPRVDIPSQFLTPEERSNRKRQEQELLDRYRTATGRQQDVILSVVREIA